MHGKKKTFKMSIYRYVIQKQQKKVALMRKYTPFVVGNSITCVINCNYRMVATLYTVETWCVAGVHCVMVIIDDDDDDDEDDDNNNNGNNNKKFHTKFKGFEIRFPYTSSCNFCSLVTGTIHTILLALNSTFRKSHLSKTRCASLAG